MSVNQVQRRMVRRMVWDIIPCPEENIVGFMPKLGLLPGSDEGNGIEHHDSHARYNEIMPIYKELAETAEIAGMVMGTALVERFSDRSDEEKSQQVRETMEVSRAVCQAVVANLVDCGYLHLPHRAAVAFSG